MAGKSFSAERLYLAKDTDGHPNLEPHFEDVQAHYDLSDDFFRLFLDPTQTYSCAYFERDDMTLEEAQIAKIDLSLGKLGLAAGHDAARRRLRLGRHHEPRHRALRRQRRRPDAQPQPAGARPSSCFAESDSPRTKRVLLQGWEQFDEPVDRIVSIGAFEHFGRDRYDDFFKMAYTALPADGVMMLHTIVKPSDEEFTERELPVTMTQPAVLQIHHGRDLPRRRSAAGDVVEEHATKAGFEVSWVQPLRLHYARTLDIWAAALEARKDEAIAIQSEEVYDRYMKYLTGCADLFRKGYTDVCQFTLVKS